MNIKISKNKYNFKLEDLVVVGNRANNPKRNFLFISKVLGKHLEVKADVCKAMGVFLGHILYEDISPIDSIKLKDYLTNPNDIYIRDEISKEIVVDEKVLVIGFAETATALGMGVASSIKDSYYVSTTRENIKTSKSFLNFEEEHSHATSHKCYLEDINRLTEANRVVLVDDEITTGNTMLNLIKELKKISSAKKYTVLTILDFRNDEYLEKYKEFEKEYDVEIEVKSVISGVIENDDFTVHSGDYEEELVNHTQANPYTLLKKVTHTLINGAKKDYLKYSERFGIKQSQIRIFEIKASSIARLADVNWGDKVLVLGHGENMYLPSRVASYLKADFKTTSRSPIFVKDEEEYPINSRHFFYVDGIKYYLYNKEKIEKEYDRVILITEDKIDIALTNNIQIIQL